MHGIFNIRAVEAQVQGDVVDAEIADLHHVAPQVVRSWRCRLSSRGSKLA
jgi:hypothetical protein